MLQKLALAVKTKTIEFFAEEDDDDDRSSVQELCLDAGEEVIADQRVVVIKPDRPAPPQRSRLFLRSLASSLFATVSAFHAAYLQLQAAQEPFQQETVEAADRAAVAHLRRLSELREAFRDGRSDGASLPSELEARVLENQSLLRKYETAFNRLQSDVDRRDADVGVLRRQLEEITRSNDLLCRRLENSSSFTQREAAFLTVGVFESVLKECCRTAHQFAKVMIRLMKDSGWNLELATNAICPDVAYAKSGHCKYAILSYICMCMFDGFGSPEFLDNPPAEVAADGKFNCKPSREDFVGQFTRQLMADSIELLATEPDCELARFCRRKYVQLIHPKLSASLVGNLDWRDRPNPLYEPFVLMGNAIWMLHRLALAFCQPVEIFRVARGADFSIVYMDTVLRDSTSAASNCKKRRQSVAFTIVPGFYVGRTVIQCKVYLDCPV